MELNWVNKLIAVLVGLMVIAASLMLAGWFVRFQGVMTIDRLFSEYNPIGVLGVFAILIFGGFYLLNAGFGIIKSGMKN